MTSPTNEQQRVDVLAVLSDMTTTEALLGHNFDRAHKLEAIRQAVAKLIEAVWPIVELAELFDDELRGGNMPKDDSDPIMQWPRVHKEYELNVGHLRNLRAALVNVGAAK